MVEGSLQPENYETPIAYKINSDIKTRLSATSQKNINVYFKEFQVDTDVGFFIENKKSEKSMLFDSVNSDITDRSILPDGTSIKQPVPFIEWNFLSSNKKITYTREYKKIIDVLGDVGGIVEVITFLVAICYAWYNTMRME
jgi:hypothetical protein